MLPIVIYEALIKSFNFYQDGCVYEGMSYGQQLYKFVGSYTAASRLQAYALGSELSYQGNRTIVTVSDRRYKVWIELRCHAATHSAATHPTATHPAATHPAIDTSQSSEPLPAFL